MADEKDKATLAIRSVATRLGIDQNSLKFDDTHEDSLSAKASLGEFNVTIIYYYQDSTVLIHFRSEEISISTASMPVDSSDKIESVYNCIKAKRRENCPWMARAVADILLNELGAKVVSPLMRDTTTCELSVIYTTYQAAPLT